MLGRVLLFCRYKFRNIFILLKSSKKLIGENILSDLKLIEIMFKKLLTQKLKLGFRNRGFLIITVLRIQLLRREFNTVYNSHAMST